MPLIVFSVNTGHATITDTRAIGMEADGGFKIRHQLKEVLPPDTHFTLKSVFINSAGAGRLELRGENKMPMMWASVDFPQLSDRIITRRDRNQYLRGVQPIPSDPPLSLRNDGEMRFPITCFPVNGKDVNSITRQANSAQGALFNARGMHVTNIPLGTIRMEEGHIECVLKPYSFAQGDYPKHTGGVRFPQIRQIQVILEYK